MAQNIAGISGICAGQFGGYRARISPYLDQEIPLTKAHRDLKSLIARTPCSTDVLAKRAHKDRAEVLALLNDLRRRGEVEQTPDWTWRVQE